MIGLLLIAVVLVLAGYGSYTWAHTAHNGASAARSSAGPGISPLAEAAAYAGAVLIFAGVSVAVARRWNVLPDWAHVVVLGGTAVLFVLAGLALAGQVNPGCNASSVSAGSCPSWRSPVPWLHSPATSSRSRRSEACCWWAR